MDIYNAIMKASKYIESNPKEFAWMSVEVPTAEHCGTPGCAVGWIGMFSGARKGPMGFRDVSDSLGIPSAGTFYVRMGDLCEEHEKDREIWKHSSPACARVMRLYAAKYHAPVVPPDWNAIASRQTIAEHERSQELA